MVALSERRVGDCSGARAHPLCCERAHHYQGAALAWEMQAREPLSKRPRTGAAAMWNHDSKDLSHFLSAHVGPDGSFADAGKQLRWLASKLATPPETLDAMCLVRARALRAELDSFFVIPLRRSMGQADAFSAALAALPVPADLISCSPTGASVGISAAQLREGPHAPPSSGSSQLWLPSALVASAAWVPPATRGLALKDEAVDWMLRAFDEEVLVDLPAVHTICRGEFALVSVARTRQPLRGLLLYHSGVQVVEALAQRLAAGSDRVLVVAPVRIDGDAWTAKTWGALHDVPDDVDLAVFVEPLDAPAGAVKAAQLLRAKRRLVLTREAPRSSVDLCWTLDFLGYDLLGRGCVPTLSDMHSPALLQRQQALLARVSRSLGKLSAQAPCSYRRVLVSLPAPPGDDPQGLDKQHAKMRELLAVDCSVLREEAGRDIRRAKRELVLWQQRSGSECEQRLRVALQSVSDQDPCLEDCAERCAEEAARLEPKAPAEGPGLAEILGNLNQALAAGTFFLKRAESSPPVGQCPVCWEDRADLCILGCGHQECEMCIRNNAEVGKAYCPICRARISFSKPLADMQHTPKARALLQQVEEAVHASPRERVAVIAQCVALREDLQSFLRAELGNVAVTALVGKAKQRADDVRRWVARGGVILAAPNEKSAGLCATTRAIFAHPPVALTFVRAAALEDRAIRLLQGRDGVRLVYLIGQGTVEERLFEGLERAAPMQRGRDESL